MERARLSAARYKRHWSLEEAAAQMDVDKATLQRWEKGKSAPQAINLRRLCEVYEMTAWELGLEEEHSVVAQNTTASDPVDDALASFRQQYSTLRLMQIVWNWSYQNARYQMLQSLIMLELEDNTMHDEVSRRNALRFLALVPIDMLGLSQSRAVLKSSQEDILKHCAAGITACWSLRKGKDLAFADQAVSQYIPTLKAIVQIAPEAQRKAAANLVIQCFLLKAALAWTIATANDTVLHYAQEAEAYCTTAQNRLLHITTVRLKAAALWHINQWKQALLAAEQAKYLIDERDSLDKQKRISVSSHPAEEPIPQLVYSHVYIGLANSQAHEGRKEDALSSLKKARSTFFAQSGDEPVPMWIDHSVGNLLVVDSEAYMHLGLYQEAVDTLEQMDTRYAQDANIAFSFRIEAAFDQVMAEVSRNDQPRRMDWCIDKWKKGVDVAKTVQSERRLNEAIQLWKVMGAAWPGEKSIKDLREYVTH